VITDIKQLDYIDFLSAETLDKTTYHADIKLGYDEYMQRDHETTNGFQIVPEDNNTAKVLMQSHMSVDLVEQDMQETIAIREYIILQIANTQGELIIESSRKDVLSKSAAFLDELQTKYSPLGLQLNYELRLLDRLDCPVGRDDLLHYEGHAKHVEDAHQHFQQLHKDRLHETMYDEAIENRINLINETSVTKSYSTKDTQSLQKHSLLSSAAKSNLDKMNNAFQISHVKEEVELERSFTEVCK